jgi:hypothetical protein
MAATSTAVRVSSVRYRTTPRRLGHRPIKHHANNPTTNPSKVQFSSGAHSALRPITRVAAGDGRSIEEPLDAVVFTVIVDDLVFPDGKTKMGVMGRVRLRTRSPSTFSSSRFKYG